MLGVAMLEQLQRAVGRAIVDDNDLVERNGLANRAIDGFADKSSVVVVIDEAGELHAGTRAATNRPRGPLIGKDGMPGKFKAGGTRHKESPEDNRSVLAPLGGYIGEPGIRLRSGKMPWRQQYVSFGRGVCG